MNGDLSRFARMDYVDEAWRIVDPVLQPGGAVYEYDPHTWGPHEADSLLIGCSWNNPVVPGTNHGPALDGKQ